MHLYITTRGQKNLVDNYINDLQAQYYPYKMDPHNTQPMQLQLGVRPLQFWEITFPREELNNVLATIGGGKIETTDKRKCVRLAAWILKLARFFGLKPVPDVIKDTPVRIIRRKNVDVKLIGLKDDQDAKIELV